MKPDQLFCDIFLLALLAFTVHKPQQILKFVGATDQ